MEDQVNVVVENSQGSSANQLNVEHEINSVDIRNGMKNNMEQWRQSIGETIEGVEKMMMEIQMPMSQANCWR